MSDPKTPERRVTPDGESLAEGLQQAALDSVSQKIEDSERFVPPQNHEFVLSFPIDRHKSLEVPTTSYRGVSFDETQPGKALIELAEGSEEQAWFEPLRKFAKAHKGKIAIGGFALTVIAGAAVRQVRKKSV